MQEKWQNIAENDKPKLSEKAKKNFIKMAEWRGSIGAS